MMDYLERRLGVEDPRLASMLEELSFWSSRFGALLFRHLELKPGIMGLDLGCGNGFPLLELAHTHGPTCRFAGVDLWQPALVRASMKAGFYGLSNVWVARSDGVSLPFREGQFDLIISNLGINNFQDPAAVFRDCFRVARRGARLAATTNIKGHMQQFYDQFRQTLIDLGKEQYLDRLDAQENHRGSQESVCGLLEDAGFRIHRAIVEPFVMRYLDGSALLRHSLTRIGFLEGWRNVLDPADENLVFGELEERLNEDALRKGELRMTVPMLYVEGTR